MRTTRSVVSLKRFKKSRFSDLQLLILASVSKVPKHGHAILQDLAASYGTKLGPGALYGAIARLERKRLIAPLPRAGRKQQYRITQDGLDLLQAQVATIRRLAVPSSSPGDEAPQGLRLPIPSFYEVQRNEDVNREIGEVSGRPKDYNADQLPFNQLGGRRFEVLTYLLKRDEFPNSVVTLVKSSGDRGRDVLVHRDGLLTAVIQCKNLDHKLSLPELLEELLKFVLHAYREQFIPEAGVHYEVWIPGGLTEPAESLIANWPQQVSEDETRKAFANVVRRYKSLSSLTWNDVAKYLTQTLTHRIRLQRHDALSLSHRVRANAEIFSRFFDGTIVMKREHVEQYFDSAFGSQLDSARKQITGRIEDLTGRIEGDCIDSEINEARDFINQHKFSDAAVILRRLQSKKAHLLSKQHRYRIISNCGAIAVGEGKPDDAARHFLEAALLEPDDERARVNEVFAHFLRRDLVKTFQMATERRSLYPCSTRLSALWIMSAPSSTSLAEIESTLDPSLFNDHEVCVALARRAMMAGQWGSAKKYADTAVLAAPKWSQPRFVRAQLGVGQLAAEHSGFKSLPAEERATLLSSAIEDATRSIELAEIEGPWASAEALVVRSELYLLNADIPKATADAKAAWKLDCENLNVLLTLAQCHFVTGALEQGIDVLTEAYGKEPRPDVVLMYARALADRSRDGDLQKAIDIILKVDVTALPTATRSLFSVAALHCISKKGDWSAAQTFIEKAQPALDQAATHALKGFVHHGRGEVDDANVAANDASRSITDDTDAGVKEFLAGLFMQLDRPTDALPIYQELFDKHIPSFNPDRLLACAAKLHLDDKVMEVCEKLHARQGLDWRRLEFEVQYLEQYSKQKAIDRLQEFLQLNPEHKLAQLRLSVIGFLHRRPEFIRAAIRDLPTVDELPIEYLGPALGILRLGDDHDLVGDYAYRFLRGHFDRQEAHEAFIQAILTRPDSQYPPELDVVVENSAVLCQELPSGDLRWFVLEDTEKPVRDFEEISLNDPIAKELLGKKVGDRFLLARASVANREAAITKIMPKYVRRFQDCSTELQVRFGPSAMLQSVQMGSDTSIDQRGLVSLMMSVQERAKLVALTQSSYAEQPMSLHIYGSRFNKNAYVALQHIAQTDGMALKCFDGNPATAEQAMSTLRERPALLIDLSAVATIRLLGLEWILGTKVYRFVATQATWEELQETFSELESFGDRQRGSFSYQEGKYILQEEDAETAAQRKSEDKAFLDSFQSNVEIVPATQLAAVEPKTRELMLNYLGRYGAETIALAGQPRMILWSDDAPQSGLAAKVFGAKRACTQMVLLSFTEAGVLQPADYTRAVARMIGMGFTSTFFDAPCVLESAKLAQYRTGRFPLKQMLDVFQQAGSPARDLVRQFLGFFGLLQQEPLLLQQKAVVVSAFLNALWRNPSTHDLVLSLRSVSAKLFGLNVVAENEFNGIFDAWFRSLSRPIV
jgi:DNA-binding PadR family transcriptional regulator/tetratricopeptide (TPR) repeat protein